jgi:hypothetical protein
LLVDDAEPPGPLDAADPPLVPPLLAAAPPLPPLDIAPLLVPPVAPEVVVSLLELALELGLLGVAVVEDDEDEPPGTTIVSRFSVVEDDAEPLGAAPPGTTVVSLRSHAENAIALTRITTQLPSFMSTLLSSTFAGCTTGLASTMPNRPDRRVISARFA